MSDDNNLYCCALGDIAESIPRRKENLVTMSVDNNTPLPLTVTEGLDKLREAAGAHDSLLKLVLKRSHGQLPSTNIGIFAVLNRSLALIDGFCSMAERRNKLCGMALIRMELDNALFIYAYEFGVDRETVATALLDGKKLSDVSKSMLKSGKGKLSEKELHEALTGEFDWVTPLYKETCQYIHMSQELMMSPIEDVRDGAVYVRINPAGEIWEDAEIYDAIDKFFRALNLLLLLCAQYIGSTFPAEAED